ncbi:MAG: tetratricopeptide repeat protein [Bacteroidetes bacterium]|nr:tetratricopeptide repeat protein [Bacteroidota bacterium]
MKIVKHLKQTILTGAVVCLPFFALSQNDPLVQAFSKSYQYEKSYDYTNAINSLKTVYNTASYELNLRLGYLSYMAGFHKESMAYYKVAIELNPKAVEPRFGYVYPAAALGLTDELVTQYTAILQIDPQNTLALYRMGYIYFLRKDFPAAKTYLGKLVSLYPFSYDGLILYAKTEQQLGEKAEALNLFNRVLLLSPTDKEANEAVKQLKQ